MRRATARKLVRAGVGWLDREAPGWEPTIDLGTLDLWSPALCPLGQVFADKAAYWGSGYGYGKALLGTRLQWSPAEFGFSGATSGDVRKLQAAWADAIVKRRRERERLTAVIEGARPRV